MYGIKPGFGCGQATVDPNSPLTKARLAEAKKMGVVAGVGTCASQGYTYQVTDLPAVLPAGETLWEKPEMEVRLPGPYYRLYGTDVCLEETNITKLDMTIEAQKGIKLTPGSCAALGFTKKVSSKTVMGASFDGYIKPQAVILLI